MNNQLTRWQETGAIWETVNTSIQEGFDNPDNFLNSQVGSLLATAENKRALSEIQQADWDKDLENQAKLAELFNDGALYQQGEETLEAVKDCQKDLHSTMERTGYIGKVDQDMYEHLTKVYPRSYADKIDSVAGGVSAAGATLASILAKLKKAFPDDQKIYYSHQTYQSGDWATGSHFATGGLSTQTGPAWLDGTPSNPEYVLNADQTKAFFNLVDTLTSSEGKSGGVSGDNYFDIDINVDELANDYDVENVAEKIKQMIWEDSQYRNVNLVNLLR